MVTIFGLVIGVCCLYLWLTGHWFGWVLAFFPAALTIQIIFGSPSASIAETLFYLFLRCLGVVLVTGVPCLLWGTVAQNRY